MAHAFEIGGEAHAVWLARSAFGYRVHVGEHAVAAALLARGEQLHDLVLGDRSQPVFIARHGDAVHVHLDGEAHVLRFVHNLDRNAGRADDDGAAVATAPMPGVVIAVSVAAGAAVRRGQPLLVIESMKMETTIAAPCDGTVQRLHVAVGQTFDRDAPLATLERAPA